MRGPPQVQDRGRASPGRGAEREAGRARGRAGREAGRGAEARLGPGRGPGGREAGDIHRGCAGGAGNARECGGESGRTLAVRGASRAGLVPRRRSQCGVARRVRAAHARGLRAAGHGVGRPASAVRPAARRVRSRLAQRGDGIRSAGAGERPGSRDRPHGCGCAADQGRRGARFGAIRSGSGIGRRHSVRTAGALCDRPGASASPRRRTCRPRRRPSIRPVPS